jgi:hypothetical protein
MSTLIFIAFIGLFLILMGRRRKTYNPRDYETIDVEATSGAICASSHSPDAPDDSVRCTRHGIIRSVQKVLILKDP